MIVYIVLGVSLLDCVVGIGIALRSDASLPGHHYLHHNSSSNISKRSGVHVAGVT